MARMVCIGVIVTETTSGENIARRQLEKNGGMALAGYSYHNIA